MNAQPFFYPAVALVLLALPLVFGWIPRNRFFGFRTPKTLGNEDAWYAANRLAGVTLMIGSGIYLGVASLYPMAGAHDPRFGLWAIHLVSFIVPIGAGLLGVGRYLRRY